MLGLYAGRKRAQGDAEAVNPPAEETSALKQFINDPTVMPSTIAQQVVAVVPGIAGGIAGFWLAGRLANANRVKTSGVLAAAGLTAVVTLFTVLLVVESEEFESA
jgi:predicted benzoate:H+ symporter BenE